MESMKYFCPNRCHISDNKQNCPRCGHTMNTLGKVTPEKAMEKISHDKLGRGNHNKPFRIYATS